MVAMEERHEIIIGWIIEYLLHRNMLDCLRGFTCNADTKQVLGTITQRPAEAFRLRLRQVAVVLEYKRRQLHDGLTVDELRLLHGLKIGESLRYDLDWNAYHDMMRRYRHFSTLGNRKRSGLMTELRRWLAKANTCLGAPVLEVLFDNCSIPPSQTPSPPPRLHYPASTPPTSTRTLTTLAALQSPGVDNDIAHSTPQRKRARSLSCSPVLSSQFAFESPEPSTSSSSSIETFTSLTPVSTPSPRETPSPVQCCLRRSRSSSTLRISSQSSFTDPSLSQAQRHPRLHLHHLHYSPPTKQQHDFDRSPEQVPTSTP
eukprot:NODE_3893_length_1147_cov_20.837891_g3703_i0.p1 GENE.NODE_3893_length_1147_cov_20.837891_g3703_i0~~NODE_3893_length_1147_cov_20.837891_g3703_i0.p1  ORF type:complete len:334 (-),score=50.94 NODE_3893_length_1147_cov_20.837891_g3703_i0:145-1089(-)